MNSFDLETSQIPVSFGRTGRRNFMSTV